MKIDISGRHKFEVSEMLYEYIHDKMAKLEKYSLKIESAHVILEAEKQNQSCEVVLLGKNLRCTGTQTTKAMQASVDGAITKVQHQLQRYHDKIKQHRHEKPKVELVVDNEDEDQL